MVAPIPPAHTHSHCFPPSGYLEDMYDQLKEEGKTSTWHTDHLAYSEGATSTGTASSGVMLKDNLEEKNSMIFLQKKKKSRAGFLVVDLVVYFAREKVKYHLESWQWQMAWPMDPEFGKEKEERMTETRKSGDGGMWMHIWVQAQSKKSTVSRFCPPERHLAWSLSFCWCPSQCWHSMHTNKVAMVAETEAGMNPWGHDSTWGTPCPVGTVNGQV